MGTESSPSFLSRLSMRHKLLFMLSIPIIIVGLCFSLCWGLYWLFELRPQYIELDPPEHPGLTWHYTERSTVNWDDSDSRYWVVRREGIWDRVSSCDGTAISTSNDVIDHFDTWLTADGWERIDDQYQHGTPCRSILSEGNDPTVGNGATFRPVNTSDWRYSSPSSICVVVWPLSRRYYGVLLGSKHTSPLTEFWDDW